MSDSNLPVPTGGLGKAAEKLADTVRHVVDLIAGPDRIRAKAQAQADAEIIAAEGTAQVREIEARSVDRLRKREVRRQRNIESITVQASAALPPPDQVSTEPVNEDWTTRFFEECQDIGDVQMQQIWARILAGEVSRPGSFEPRTLSIVKDLTKRDAELFAALCSTVWFVQGVGFNPIVHEVEPELYKTAGITFSALTHLTSIGLIEFSPLSGFGVTKQTEVFPQYCGKIYRLRRETEDQFPLGKIIFTSVGRQLLKVVHAEGKDEYKNAALAGWAKKGWVEPTEDLHPVEPSALQSEENSI